jgi:hypothetical protein
MVQIGKTICSFDLFDQYFRCELTACKGACCVDGDSGAPLEPEEVLEIEKNYLHFKPYLDKNYIRVIEEQGFSVTDKEGDIVTPLYKQRECVYTINENGTTFCAIEKAYFEGKSHFQKPISCHLYPIRITRHETFDAINYQQIDICRAGRVCGLAQKIPLYRFLKEPLIRKYGQDWYDELEITAEELKNYKRENKKILPLQPNHFT